MEEKEYVCFEEKQCEVLNKVDSYFRQAALRLGGREYHIPAMIKSDALERCGYFKTAPQHLTLASYFDQEYLHQNSKEVGGIPDFQMKKSDIYLTPAACLHIYPMLENEILDNKIITTRARVYRYENDNFNGSTRLWDFTVREIVFIGTRKFVSQKLIYMENLALSFAHSLGIYPEICSANDHFIPNRENRIKMKFQKSNSLKKELVLKGKFENVSLCSFNFHETHFSKAFSFDNGGEIVSGCVGFGLERWVEALTNNSRTK